MSDYFKDKKKWKDENYPEPSRESKEWINNQRFKSESMDFNEMESVIWRKVTILFLSKF
jgi:hypothetical protein